MGQIKFYTIAGITLLVLLLLAGGCYFSYKAGINKNIADGVEKQEELQGKLDKVSLKLVKIMQHAKVKSARDRRKYDDSIRALSKDPVIKIWRDTYIPDALVGHIWVLDDNAR